MLFELSVDGGKVVFARRLERLRGHVCGLLRRGRLLFRSLREFGIGLALRRAACLGLLLSLLRRLDGLQWLFAHRLHHRLPLLVDRSGLLLGRSGGLLGLAAGLLERRHLRAGQCHLWRQDDRHAKCLRLGDLPFGVAGHEAPRHGFARREAELLGRKHGGEHNLRVGRPIGQRHARQRHGRCEVLGIGADPHRDAVEPPVVEDAALNLHVVGDPQREQRGRLLHHDRRWAIDRGRDLDGWHRQAGMARRTAKFNRGPDRLFDRHTADPGLCGNKAGDGPRRWLRRGDRSNVRFRLRLCKATHRDRLDRSVDGLLHRLRGAVHPAWAIEQHAAAVDAKRHGGHNAADEFELRQILELRGQPHPFAGRRQRAGDEAENALGRGHGGGVAPDQLHAAVIALQQHRQPAGRIDRIESCHQHHRPLREQIAGQHERLQPRSHPEGHAFKAKREAAQAAGRVGGGPLPRRLRNGVPRQVVLKPDSFVIPLHITVLESPLRDLQAALDGVLGDIGDEFHRRSLQCLDATSVVRDRNGCVDPHEFGQPDLPSDCPDFGPMQQRDGVGFRPRAAPFEPIGRRVVEPVELRDKTACAGGSHRMAEGAARRVEDHEFDGVNAAADHAGLDLQRLPLQHRDVTGRPQLQPGGRGDVGRRMQEPLERDDQPLAERQVEREDQRQGPNRQCGIAGQCLPSHDSRGAKARQTLLRLVEQLFDHVGLKVVPRSVAAGQVHDRQQTVVDATERALDPKAYRVEQRPPQRR